MTSVSDLTTKILGVKYEWSNANIKVDVVYSFHACSKKIKIEAKITNLGPLDMEDPAFLIMVDADQDADTQSIYQTVDTIQGQVTMGNTYTSVCSVGQTEIALCMSSSKAESYAYRKIDLGQARNKVQTIFANPSQGLEGVTNPGTATQTDQAIALVTFGPNLAQNQQTGDIGMYFGMGDLNDVKAPLEQRCT